jgi:CheY-like chemotaxis protein
MPDENRRQLFEALRWTSAKTSFPRIAACQITLAGETIDAVARTSREIMPSPPQPPSQTETGMICVAPPAGFEPAHPPPEGGALSPELWGPAHAGRQTILLAGARVSGTPISGHGPDVRAARADSRYSRAVTQGLGRVLVVDDDEVIRQLIAVNLTLEGFDVVTAVDGRDCLDKVADVEPDVITLDVMMPRLDGWVTATQLRKNPATAGIKVVLITARAQEDDRDRGRQIGVDAYLTKPFDPAEMIRVIRELAGAPASAFD